MDLPWHGGHLLVLVLVVFFAAWVGLAALRVPGDPVATRGARGRPARAQTATGPPARLLAIASLVAGLAHAVATPHHVSESALYGAFFIAVTLGQFACAGAVVGFGRGNVRLLVLALLANGAVLVTWVVSRTAGLPVGPHRTPEAIGAVDLTAAVAELVFLCFGAVWLMMRGAVPTPEPVSRPVRSAFPT